MTREHANCLGLVPFAHSRNLLLTPAKVLILRAANLRDQGVGGSNPLAPTILFKRLYQWQYLFGACL